MQEVVKDANNTILLFLVDPATGSPKTGVLDSQVTGAMAYVGGASTTFTAGLITLTEVSAANQPGWYELEIDSSYFASLGRATVRIYDAGGGGFADWNDSLNVVSTPTDDAIRKLLGLSKQNSKLTVNATNAVGYMTSGTLEIYDDKALTSLITSYTVSVTYHPVTFELQYHQVAEV